MVTSLGYLIPYIEPSGAGQADAEFEQADGEFADEAVDGERGLENVDGFLSDAMNPAAAVMRYIRLLGGNGLGQTDKPPWPFGKTVKTDVDMSFSCNVKEIVEKGEQSAVPFRDAVTVKRKMLCFGFILHQVVPPQPISLPH